MELLEDESGKRWPEIMGCTPDESLSEPTASDAPKGTEPEYKYPEGANRFDEPKEEISCGFYGGAVENSQSSGKLVFDLASNGDNRPSISLPADRTDDEVRVTVFYERYDICEDDGATFGCNSSNIIRRIERSQPSGRRKLVETTTQFGSKSELSWDKPKE